MPRSDPAFLDADRHPLASALSRQFVEQWKLRP